MHAVVTTVSSSLRRQAGYVGTATLRHTSHGDRILPRCIRHSSNVAAPKSSGSSPSLTLLRNFIDRSPSSSSSSSSSQQARIACFVRSVRKHRNVTFLAVTDGTLAEPQTVQAVLNAELKQRVDHELVPGVALELTGMMRESKGRDQTIEFAVDDVLVTGQADAAAYPLRLSESNSVSSSSSSSSDAESYADRMRRYAHLRPRDTRHAAVLRMRDSIEGAIASYFRSQDFVRVAAPILTSSDCEGGGEVFGVEAAATAKARKSFWSDAKAYLTVSAQLHLEAMALGLGRVYTVGPSFRAEGSATNRHLAEFWMCEGEQVTSSDAAEAMDQVTDVVEGVVRRVIEESMIERDAQSRYLWSNDEEARQTLLRQSIELTRWKRITYTQAIEELQTCPKGDLHSPPPSWGDSLTSEQERWLARHGPVFVTHYPATGKPFYMRLDENERTVACFDLLVPRIGELVGGSLRETRADVLQRRAAAEHVSTLSWYIDDLRRFGCNPHGGFGLGVERLLSWLSNTDSVRDVVTFPRVKGPLHF